jgi:hypothetical protein
MAKAKITTDPYEDLHEEVLERAADLASARALLRAVALEVAEHKHQSKDWAPDLAAPTALYTLTHDRYLAILRLWDAAGRSNFADLTQDPEFARERKVYNVAFA